MERYREILTHTTRIKNISSMNAVVSQLIYRSKLITLNHDKDITKYKKFEKLFNNKDLLVFFIKVNYPYECKITIECIEKSSRPQLRELLFKIIDNSDIYDDVFLGIFKYIKVDDNFDTIYVPRIINSEDINILKNNYNKSIEDYFEHNLFPIHWK